MKTYVITLSQHFPATHPRKGEPTFFKHQLINALKMDKEDVPIYGVPHRGMPNERLGRKLHTIRANYPLWKKRFEQINRGEACLSIRQWTGKPYASKQVEIARLTIEDGIGLQKLEFVPCYGIIGATVVIDGADKFMSKITLANNDGLTHDDWLDWFKDYDLSQPMAIIHFTKFRYR